MKRGSTLSLAVAFVMIAALLGFGCTTQAGPDQTRDTTVTYSSPSPGGVGVDISPSPGVSPGTYASPPGTTTYATPDTTIGTTPGTTVEAPGTTPGTTTVTTPGTTPGTTDANRGIDTPFTLNDVEFVHQASLLNMAGLQMAQLAQKQGTASSIRTFARNLMQDHKSLGDSLKQVAGSQRVAAPLTLDDAYNGKLNELKGLTGAEFDRRFVDMVVDSHEDVVKLYANAARDLKGPLGDFAASHLVALRHHLAQAESLEQNQGVSTGQDDDDNR